MELLKYGANSNYVINGFEDSNNQYHSGASPLFNASSENIEIVKSLINYKADYNQRVDGELPFGKALSFKKYDIINYYIDSLEIDINAPIKIRENDSLFIQDYVMNKFLKAKLIGDTTEINKLTKENPKIIEDNDLGWKLILKLKNLGVDFKNYSYKR